MTRLDVRHVRSYNHRNTAPYEAACAGHDEVLEVLIDRWSDIDERDHEDRTALYWAAFYGHEKVVKLLLQKGAKTNIPVTLYGWTAKEWASSKGYRSIEVLLAQAEWTDVRSYTYNYKAGVGSYA